MAEIDLKPLNKNLALGLSKLKDIKVPELKLPIFTTEQTERQLRQDEYKKRLRDDYKFYQKCLRVLRKKKGKEKLIGDIKMYMHETEWIYNRTV